jgi:hypothetical protein
MFKRDKATSPEETAIREGNAFFQGWAATKQLVKWDVGAACDSAGPAGCMHPGQYFQGFGAVLPGICSGEQIVNNFLIKYAERS